jgi:hypothetical protein
MMGKKMALLLLDMTRIADVGCVP